VTTPSPAELLAHMQAAVEQALDYVEGMSRADFLADKRTNRRSS